MDRDQLPIIDNVIDLGYAYKFTKEPIMIVGDVFYRNLLQELEGISHGMKTYDLESKYKFNTSDNAVNSWKIRP